MAKKLGFTSDCFETINVFNENTITIVSNTKKMKAETKPLYIKKASLINDKDMARLANDSKTVESLNIQLASVNQQISDIESKYNPAIQTAKDNLKSVYSYVPNSLFCSYAARIENGKDKAGRIENGKGEITVYETFKEELKVFLKSLKVKYTDNDKAVSKLADPLLIVIGGKLNINKLNMKTVTAYNKRQFSDLLFAGIIQYGLRLCYWTLDESGKLSYNDKDSKAKEQYLARKAEEQAKQEQAKQEQARLDKESLLHYKHMQIAYTAHLYAQYSKRIRLNSSLAVPYRRIVSGNPSIGRKAIPARFSKPETENK